MKIPNCIKREKSKIDDFNYYVFKKFGKNYWEWRDAEDFKNICERERKKNRKRSFGNKENR